uniref:Uncharacterized protein n=1 Tax=Trypanosoma vivax (strain Y486) TaxID=1055687 RepID=G0U863_TRYVY|nr:conserved hypothetical protein [Trypanosoma vivax Y486]
MWATYARLLRWGAAAVSGQVVPPRRRRQFVMKEGQEGLKHHDNNDSDSSFPKATTPHRPAGGVTHALSQREEYRYFQKEREEALCSHGSPGEWLTPLPHRFTIDEHSYENSRPTRHERETMLRQALERDGASAVEFTDGGEENIELCGLSSGDFHAQEGSITVPRESALYNTVLARGELESRARHNSWSVARQMQSLANERGVFGSMNTTTPNAAGKDIIDDSRRRRRADEGSYTNVFDGDLLEPNYESVGYPRSTYGMRKMLIDGLTGYQGIITREEEALICEELMHLLHSNQAAYIAEETRYCVNVYEKELEVPGKDTLAFAMARVPTLRSVLKRFVHLGLIPSPPNICQVSEMIGNFSGYPVHKKPPTIGPYVGILNLVSTTVMHMQHVNNPWFPRLHMNPRSLFVVEQPCLSEYKMGYKQTHQPFHTFEYATRVSKDYRIEVLFAMVEVAQTRCLREAVGIAEYAQERLRRASDSQTCPNTLQLPHSFSSQLPTTGEPVERTCEQLPFGGLTEKWLPPLQRLLRSAEGGNAGTHDSSEKYVVDGNALRERLLASGGIGCQARAFDSSAVSGGRGQQKAATSAGAAPGAESSPTNRRVAALKARYELAKKLKESNRVTTPPGGVRVIRGHSPHDRSNFG